VISREPFLQFARESGCSQLRAFAGDVLYKEGMPATNLYLIREGEVDLFHVRDGKRTVVETLRKGQCFGIEPHLEQPVRMHNAAARSYCELALVNLHDLAESVADSAGLAQGLLRSLSERLVAAHRLIATRVNYQPELQVYAQILYLLGMADVGRAAVVLRPGAEARSPQAQPLLQEVVHNAKLMLGHSERHIMACLGRLQSAHLVHIEDDAGSGKRVRFAVRDIVGQVRRLVAGDSDADKLTHETLSLDEFADLVEVERTVLLRKLASGDFADNVFTFRREEILRLLDSQGRRYFAERRVKAPQEFTDVSDLEFADSKALFAALSRRDSLELAKLLAPLSGEPVRQRILDALSRRRREEVEADLEGLQVDAVEAQQIGAALIDEVRKLMLDARAG
jgi:CRP-like cAMP-binding protein